MNDRRRVIESPLSGDFVRNQRYARWCMLDCFTRGEAPFVSHLLYTQVLDDREPAHREMGIEAGFAWAEGVQRVFYLDLCPVVTGDADYVGTLMHDGVAYRLSSGMLRAAHECLTKGQWCETRLLPPLFMRQFTLGNEPKGT